MLCKQGQEWNSHPRRRMIPTQNKTHISICHFLTGLEPVSLHVCKRGHFHVVPPPGARSYATRSKSTVTSQSFHEGTGWVFRSIYPLADSILPLRQWMLLLRECSWLLNLSFFFFLESTANVKIDFLHCFFLIPNNALCTAAAPRSRKDIIYQMWGY